MSPPPYFFYGTLLDPEVRRLVLGRAVPAGHCRAACLAGWRRVHRRGAAVPVLIRDGAGGVDGLAVAGVSRGEAARLARFEGPDYRTALLAVTLAAAADGSPDPPWRRDAAAIRARVFIPVSPALAGDAPWDFAAWAAHHRAPFVARLRAPHPPRQSRCPSEGSIDP